MTEKDLIIQDLRRENAKLRARVPQWVSVDDMLPPYNQAVLVYRPNMAMEILVDNYAGYYGEDDNEWHEGWAKYGKDIHGKSIITHWAYLPQPPKGE